jgi:tetratricopeptide (TPR) repeat protein
LGLYGEALTQLNEAYGIAERLGDRAHRARMLNTLGWLYAELSAPERASEYNQRSVELADEMLELDLVAGTEEIRCNASINLAGNRIAEGDPDAADALLESVRREWAEGEDPWMRWRWSIHLEHVEARLALVRGDPQRALGHVGREVEAARRQGAPKLVARGLELRGRACLVMDDRDGAEKALREALREAQAIGYPPAAWRAKALLAELARRTGDGAAAERADAEVARSVETAAATLDDDALRGRLRGLGRDLAKNLLAGRV